MLLLVQILLFPRLLLLLVGDGSVALEVWPFTVSTVRLLGFASDCCCCFSYLFYLSLIFRCALGLMTSSARAADFAENAQFVKRGGFPCDRLKAALSVLLLLWLSLLFREVFLPLILIALLLHLHVAALCSFFRTEHCPVPTPPL